MATPKLKHKHGTYIIDFNEMTMKEYYFSQCTIIKKTYITGTIIRVDIENENKYTSKYFNKNMCRLLLSEETKKGFVEWSRETRN